MTRPKASPLVFVGVLATAGAGILLWCAWLVLTAPLPGDAAAAAWALWLLAVAAFATLIAYLRELVRHGALARRGSWKPRPGLLLLWVAGLTALLAFPFVLPERSGATRSDRPATQDRSAPDTSPPGGATPDGTTASAGSAATGASRSSTATRAPSPAADHLHGRHRVRPSAA
ncbi:hypothetical protein [Phycicoccus sp. Root101]|uniref:hypothetical protein n=1 Tax=Phycicoccus sp. Root101 TaxID=1736421 RepID=UPI00070330DB|nr:hypothetical protein [Phycicoccus sp. Root101]KQU66324.1 hypothetical protein ASC58_14780 [Phycicoccus sp. Root101]